MGSTSLVRRMCSPHPVPMPHACTGTSSASAFLRLCSRSSSPSRRPRPPGSGSAGTRVLTPLDRGILSRLNQIRAEHKLAPLRGNWRLATAADKHSRDMVARGFFDHDSVAGTFEQRLERLYGSSSSGNWSAGENILWSPEQLDPKRALEIWMASPPHRANI